MTSEHLAAGADEPCGQPTTGVKLSGLLTDVNELAGVADRFPAFQIWRAVIYDRIRYVAQSTSLDIHPYAVITHDLAELQAVLAVGQRASE